MAANTQSYTPTQTASTPTRTAPRPTVAPWSLCRACGGEYYPDDIPAVLADVGQYGTCADCRAEFVADMAVWAVAS